MTAQHVDLHCHFIPPALVDLIAAEGPSHAIHLSDDGIVSFAERVATQPFPQGMLDLERREAWMDAQDVDVQVVSAWMDFSAYVLEPEDGRWLARSLNELTVEAIEGRTDRFRAMAAVPLQAPELAAQELRFAVDELGMVAVEIATSVVDAELDDVALEPFWRAAEELGVLVFIHPYASIGSDRLTRYFLNNLVGNPAEETVAAAHLIYGGVLERHPRLEVCLTHGGGFLPYQIGRQDRGFHSLPKLTATHLHAAPCEFLRRFYYDTVVHSSEALQFLVGRVGADRVVLGSDYPFPMGDPEPVAAVRAAGFDEATTDAILGHNVAVALGRDRLPSGRAASESPDRKGAGVEHRFLVHDDTDDVGVAVADVKGGEEVVAAFMKSGKRLRLEILEAVPLGHKVALRDLDEGSEVLKYGAPIGRTTSSVRAGEYVHTHNLRSARW